MAVDEPDPAPGIRPGASEGTENYNVSVAEASRIRVASGKLVDALEEVVGQVKAFGQMLGAQAGGGGGVAGQTYGKAAIPRQTLSGAIEQARAGDARFGPSMGTSPNSAAGVDIPRYNKPSIRDVFTGAWTTQGGRDEAAMIMQYQEYGRAVSAGAQRLGGFYGRIQQQGYPIDYAAQRGALLMGNRNERGSYLNYARNLGGFTSGEDLFTAMSVTNRFNDPRGALGTASRLGLVDPTMGAGGAAQAMQTLSSPSVMHALAPYGGGLIAPGGRMRNTEELVTQLANVATGGQAHSMSVAQARATFSETGQGRWSLRAAGVPDEIINQVQTLSVARAGGGDIGTRRGLAAAGVGGENDTLVDAELERTRQGFRTQLDAMEGSRDTLMIIADARAGIQAGFQALLRNIPGAASALAAIGSLAGPIGWLSSALPPIIAGLAVRGGARPSGGGAPWVGGPPGPPGLPTAGPSGLRIAAAGGGGGVIGGLVGGGVGNAVEASHGQGWGVGAGALSGAATGAAIGAFGGVPGTLIGGGIGAVGGALSTWLGDSDRPGEPVGDATGSSMTISTAEEIIRQRGNDRGGVAGIHPTLKVILAEMMQQNPRLTLTSGHRSTEQQRQMFLERHVPPYPGAPISAAGWRRKPGYPPTAKPGSSNHEKGTALDLDDGTGGNRTWLAANAPRWGLKLPMPGVEPWHWELTGASTPTGAEAMPPGNDGAAAPGGGMSMAQGWGGIGNTGTQGRLMELLGRAAETVGFGGGGFAEEAPQSTAGSGTAAAGPMPGNQSQQQIAQTIVAVGRRMGASPRAMLAAFEAALVESGMRNLNYGDRDSVGVFQQRTSQGWGTIEQIMNPDYAAGEFFEQAIPRDRNWNGTAGGLAQAVQRSAFPARYDQRRGEAAGWLAGFGIDVQGVAGDAMGSAAVPVAPKTRSLGSSAPVSVAMGGSKTIVVQTMALHLTAMDVTPESAKRFARMIKDELENDDKLERMGAHL